MPKKDLIGQRLVLEELRRHFDHNFSSIDAMDNKLLNILGFSSIVVSVIGLFDLGKLNELVGDYFYLWLVIILLLYLSLVISILRAIKPKDYQFPISSDWDELVSRYFYKTESIVLDRLNSDYLEFSSRISKKISLKAKTLKTASILLFTIVLILLITLSLSFAF